MILVLDASITATWFFETEQTPAAHDIMRKVAREGAIVPSLWRLEIANVLRNAVRRGRCDEAYATRSLALLSRLPITTDQETDDHAWGETRALSQAENLTLYDAAYLELAQRKSACLASCDAALLAACARLNLAVLTA